MTTASKRLLVGRKIVDFDAQPFQGEGGTAHDPVLVLDNGAMLRFVVEETGGSEYGVTPLYVPPPKWRKK